MEVKGINNHGAVVGYFVIPGPGGITASRGFKRFPHGAFEFPITHPDAHGFPGPAAINQYGTIFGTYEAPNGFFKGFILSGNTFTSIDLQPAGHTEITAANNPGDFLVRTRRFGTYQNYLYSNGVATPISIPVALPEVVWPTGIAWDKTIVGCTRSPLWGGNFEMGFVLGPEGNSIGITLGGTLHTCVTAISNQAGKIAGWWQDHRGGIHGFIYDYRADHPWSGGTFLNAPGNYPVKLISPEIIDVPGSTFTDITGINAKGQVTGKYCCLKGRYAGFIATPIQ